MNITIIRYRLKSSKNSIDGTLYIDGNRICDTTENSKFYIAPGTYPIEATRCAIAGRNIPAINVHPDLCRDCSLCAATSETNEKARLKGISAIHHVIMKGKEQGKSEAEYTAEALAFEKSLPLYVPQEPMPVCPRLRAGNCVWNETDGSIIVGQYLQPGVVIKSRPIFETLYDRIRKNLERGGEVTLTLVDDFKVVE